MRRGHVLLLLMSLLVALGIAGLLFANRASRAIEARPADDVRIQALWLARSALDAGVGGVRQVETPSGVAVVRASGGSVTVTLAGATAEVGQDEERFTPAGL